MSLKCGSVNLTKRVTLLSNASTLGFLSLGGPAMTKNTRAFLNWVGPVVALLCLLAPTILAQEPSCPSCTINVTTLETAGKANDPAAPGWSVQYWVDASSTSPYDQTDLPRDNRGLALSPTNQYLYAGYNNSTDGRGEVRKIDTLETDPLNQAAVKKVLFGFRGKAIAVDDKGRVYLAEGFHATFDPDPLTHDLTKQVVIYDSDLTTLLFSFGSEAGCTVSASSDYCLPAGSRPEGVAVVRKGNSLVLYMSDRALDTLTQFTLTESGPDISSATFNDDVIVPFDPDMRGVEVDKSGRIWIADPNSSGGQVFVYNSDLTPASPPILVSGAMDIGFDDVNAFVTQGPNAAGSTITVLSQTAPFGPVTTLTPPYAALNISTAANGIDEEPRLSGIAVACPLFDCTTPGFYVANEAAWTLAQNDVGTYDREPIIRANAGTFTPCPQGCGKVTGGGQIEVASSGSPRRAKYANYGFNVQVKQQQSGSPQPQPKGQLEYLDHSTGANYHSIAMKTLTVSDDHEKADFTGTIKKKGDPLTRYFKVHVEDHGEPGRHRDMFQITIYADIDMLTTPLYEAGFTAGNPTGLVDKGNIQIHRNCKQVE